MHFRNGPVAISYDSTLLLRLVDEGKGGSGSDRDRHHVGARELRSGRQRDELRRVARQRDRSIARPRRFPADEVTVFDAKRLRAGLGGARVVLPGDREYDTARRVWNGRIDRHPAAVVFARDVKDVRATVTLAREGGARLFVRGGGHSVAGLAVGEGRSATPGGTRDAFHAPDQDDRRARARAQRDRRVDRRRQHSSRQTGRPPQSRRAADHHPPAEAGQAPPGPEPTGPTKPRPATHDASTANPATTIVRVLAPSHGFDWGDAGIGAAAGIALAFLGLGGALLISQRRARRTRASPAATN